MSIKYAYIKKVYGSLVENARFILQLYKSLWGWGRGIRGILALLQKFMMSVNMFWMFDRDSSAFQ